MNKLQLLYEMRNDQKLIRRFESKIENKDKGRNWEWLYPKYLEMSKGN